MNNEKLRGRGLAVILTVFLSLLANATVWGQTEVIRRGQTEAERREQIERQQQRERQAAAEKARLEKERQEAAQRAEEERLAREEAERKRLRELFVQDSLEIVEALREDSLNNIQKKKALYEKLRSDTVEGHGYLMDWERLTCSFRYTGSAALAPKNYRIPAYFKTGEHVFKVTELYSRGATEMAAESIITPNTMETIRSDAFPGTLKRVSLSRSITSIWDGAFKRCRQMDSIHIDDENKCFIVEGGILYDKEKTRIIKALPNKIAGNLVVASTVTSIDEGAFRNCDQLTSVFLPARLKEVKFGTFEKCTSLTSATILNPDCILKDGAFNACENLSKVVVAQGVENQIEDMAFTRCDKLKELSVNGNNGKGKTIKVKNSWVKKTKYFWEHCLP